VRLETEFLPRRFEQAALESLVRKNRRGMMDPSFYRIGRFAFKDKAHHKKGEFAVVTEDERGLTAYECQYGKALLDLSAVRDRVRQVSELGLSFYRLGFFSRSGFALTDPKTYTLISLDDMYAEELGQKSEESA